MTLLGEDFPADHADGKAQDRCDRQGPERMLNRLDDVTEAQREQLREMRQQRMERHAGKQGMREE